MYSFYTKFYVLKHFKQLPILNLHPNLKYLKPRDMDSSQVEQQDLLVQTFSKGQTLHEKLEKSDAPSTEINNNNIADKPNDDVDHLEGPSNHNVEEIPKVVRRLELVEEEPEEVSTLPPQHKELDVLTSFSRSESTASAQRNNFFQPKPNNFFDDWPVPYHYLPASKQEKPKGFNLVKFITAGVTCNLKSLGVEELDCKEFVERWLSQRTQRRWTQSLRRNTVTSYKNPESDSGQCIEAIQTFSKTDGPTTPTSTSDKSDGFSTLNLSKPNSSLLRLAGDGNFELSQFLTRMEDVRGHLNNATCTVLQATIILMLPHLKLLSGHQLDSTSCQTFIEEWIQIVMMLAKELKPDSPAEAKVMISREFKVIRSESKKLYKDLKLLHKKIQKLFDENDKVCKKALARLHPKSVSSYRHGRDKETNSVLEDRILQSETIHFTPIPLHRANISSLELFKNHAFFSQSVKRNSIFKTEIDNEWENYAELSYNNRRELFLSVVEDLRWTLKVPSANVDHIKELCIKGYPESICTKVRDNLTFLKKIAKQDDLSVLSKVTIVTQVNCLHESMTRLLRTLKDALIISKYFYKSIKSNTYVPYGKRQVFLRKNTSVKSKTSAESSVISEPFVPLNVENSTRVKLLIPFPISTDPIEDQFFMSSV